MAGSSEGPATDRENIPVVDPTENVRYEIRSETKRQDDLRSAESAHIREIMGLHAEFARDLRLAESQRIDAIRAVDVGNVQRAAEVQAAAATALQSQVAVTAEAMRTQVASAATAWEARLLAALDPIQKDIQDLRKAQYEAQGQKAQVVETRTDQRGVTMTALAVVGAVILVLNFAITYALR